VGRGSYRNQDQFVVHLYRRLVVACRSLVTEQDDTVHRIFVQRSRCPMRQNNETLIGEFLEYAKATGADDGTVKVQTSTIEQGRRWEAKVLRQLATHEDSVDAAYHAQGLPPIPVLLDNNADGVDGVDWTRIMNDDVDDGDQTKQLGMGLGGAELALAYIRYAKAVQRVRAVNDDNNEAGGTEPKRSFTFEPPELAVAIYERAVAECPTSEPLWLSYLSDLRKFRRHGMDRLASVTERAVRNCPYSLQLARQRIHAMEYLAAASKVVIAPDELLNMAKECLDRKFLPSGAAAARELYLAVLQVIKRRIMYLLARQEDDDDDGGSSGIRKKKKNKRKRFLRYDDEEPLKASGGGRAQNQQHHPQRPLDDTIREEIEELIEDIREAYEDIAALLEGSSYDKACILNDRAWSETLLLTPLEKALESETTIAPPVVPFGLWDQALAAHKPAIPDSTRLFVEQFAAQRPVSSPRDVLTKIRNIRFLYGQAFAKANGSGGSRDADGEHLSSLRVLGKLWLSWEKCFGSERSLVKAQQAIGNKASEEEEEEDTTEEYKVEEKADEAMVQQKDEADVERKHELENLVDTKQAKRAKVEKSIIETANPDVSMVAAAPDAKQAGLVPSSTKAVHDFTVRVQKLSTSTTDMDLVDALRARCGAIVHARIVRHKDGKSKGWGLVQFEDRASVTKALELNDVLGIMGKTIVVERSYMPAAPLVPPGMHRVAAKGEGKTSKRNEKRKERIAIK
jgi:hypothetical protein